MTHKTEDKVTAFFDGQCPYCKAEVALLRLVDVHDRVIWSDINTHRSALAEQGIGFDAAMADLHVVDGRNDRHIGVSGFMQIWSRLPLYRFLYLLLRRFPRMRRLAERFYRYFSVWRLKRKAVSRD